MTFGGTGASRGAEMRLEGLLTSCSDCFGTSVTEAAFGLGDGELTICGCMEDS